MDTAIELAEVGISFIFEYFATNEVSSVPNNATCHTRSNRVNCVAFAAWEADKEPKGNLGAAVGQPVNILIFAEKNAGYGNYRKFLYATLFRSIAHYDALFPVIEDPANTSSGSRASADQPPRRGQLPAIKSPQAEIRPQPDLLEEVPDHL